MSKFYITSAIPYVNAKPHIGWSTEIIHADVIARYKSITGNDVLFLCGSDENALKNVQAASLAGNDVQSFVNKNADAFESLAKALDIRLDVFQRGSTKNHHTSSQKLWELCEKSGDIYKKVYKGLYCVGCETFYTTGELNENGECFEHPGKKLEEVEEENYFFKLSKHRERLQALISSNEYEIVPAHRKNEMLKFIEQGLEDFSISRSNKRAKEWGVEVPNDPTQRIYVWFDALNIYQSGIGFGENDKMYKKWWPADVHVIGKGIIRFHAIYWPAILLSAGLQLPKKLFVHEYLTVNGQKISKSLGNAIDPLPIIKEYGTDALRYYLLSKISPFSDSDFTLEKFKEVYNADLANGLGNLIARVSKLCEQNEVTIQETTPSIANVNEQEKYFKHLENFEFNLAIEEVWRDIKTLDIKISADKPWSLAKEEATPLLREYISYIRNIAYILKIFLPSTSEKIENQFKGPKIVSQKPLFPRIM